ncbi:MAG: 4Fe-4S dicluster domain-containing protein [Oscillospiraceae bacterium]|jgi:Fe-S-cluster-containing hydrogenase component 2|nr:4Fe-4S dicluster domain-containing protein [Oscillospiraceae bacterium]
MSDKSNPHIVQSPPEESFCAGCDSCEIICALAHGEAVSPARRRLFVRRDIRTMYHTVFTCRHCDDHPCYNACPKKGAAMRLDGCIAYIDDAECVGCGACARACPYDPPRVNYDRERKLARKCDLCRTREGGPACVEWCPVRCLSLLEIASEVE